MAGNLLPRCEDEKQRRLLAGAEAIAYGVGGQKRVATLLGLSQGTVSRGVQELRQPETVESDRIRRPGGGRKPTIASDPELWTDLERLVSPTTRGDPESPLRWALKSTRKLATELNALTRTSRNQTLPRDFLSTLRRCLDLRD